MGQCRVTEPTFFPQSLLCLSPLDFPAVFSLDLPRFHGEAFTAGMKVLQEKRGPDRKRGAFLVPHVHVESRKQDLQEKSKNPLRMCPPPLCRSLRSPARCHSLLLILRAAL